MAEGCQITVSDINGSVFASSAFFLGLFNHTNLLTFYVLGIANFDGISVGVVEV